MVREALKGLGEDQKVAVLLNKFEDMSYAAEIAEVMGRSEARGQVSRQARARNPLAGASSSHIFKPAKSHPLNVRWSRPPVKVRRQGPWSMRDAFGPGWPNVGAAVEALVFSRGGVVCGEPGAARPFCA